MNENSENKYKKLLVKNWARIIITCIVLLVVGSYFEHIGIGIAVAISAFAILRPFTNIISKVMILKPIILCTLVGCTWGLGIAIITHIYINYLEMGVVLTIIAYMAGFYFSILNFDVIGEKHPIEYGFEYLNYSAISIYVLASFVFFIFIK